ncbi:unnamed protein product [Candidula unifasciata]|uniref:Uncharacterized protein n=1 Tax=Candidula unifasciata TaxID=100452 RepID=A0A8S3ZP87_9EUPU|nr:unnamed protein product [Candidula unifasciata]
MFLHCLKMKHTLALLLILGTNVMTQNPCPYNVKTCTCENVWITCDHLDTIPPLVYDNPDGSIIGLTFLESNLRNVPENSLPTNLSTILFISLPLTYISPDAFNSSANTLTSLHMYNATNGQVPTALLQVKNLTDLIISDTLITEWNSTVLKHLAKTVRSLTLSNVGFTDWPAFFENFRLVSSVDFSHNNISSIPSDAFTNTSNLTSLKLRQNKLIDVNSLDVALQPLANRLETLELEQNILLSIPPSVASMPRLSELNVNDNFIRDLTNTIPPQLKHLYVSGNVIKQLTDTTFPNTTSLETLFLSSNPLSDISKLAFHPLRNLRQLEMKSISLETIPVALTSLKNLQILDLGFGFHCPCSRNEELVQWYYSLKNISITGYCYWNIKKIEYYFRTDTYKQVCMGSKLNYSIHLYLAMIVLVSFSIL